MQNIAKIAVLCLLCLCLVSCADTMEPLAYTDEIVNETEINGVIIKNHMIVAEYELEKGVYERPYLNAVIQYPEISNLENQMTNFLLKDVAFLTMNPMGSEGTLQLFERMVKEGERDFWGGDNQYEIIYADKERISVHYEGMVFFGGPYPITFSDYLTIDVVKGELIPFTAYFTKESVIKAIETRQFEWLEGYYTMGPELDEPDVIPAFVEAFDLDAKIGDEYRDYDSSCIYNFAMDEEFAYIRFYYYDALYRYNILKIKLIDLM